MNYNGADILDWYENKNGREFIHTHIQSKIKFIEQFYLYNNNTCNENAGVYTINFNNNSVYIGQAGNLAYRFITHIYNLVNRKTDWGIVPQDIENGNIKIDIKILKDSILDENERKKKEDEYIILESPILQCCYNKYYPYDKSKRDSNDNWMKREDIPVDWCIRSNLRKEAIKEKLVCEK